MARDVPAGPGRAEALRRLRRAHLYYPTHPALQAAVQVRRSGAVRTSHAKGWREDIQRLKHTLPDGAQPSHPSPADAAASASILTQNIAGLEEIGAAHFNFH